MAREYSSKRSSRRGTSVPHQLLVIVVTFILGYFTASIFDIEALSHWMSTHVLEGHEAQQAVATAQMPHAQAQHEVTQPKPKFEFYTLLANEKGVGAAASANTRPAATQAAANQTTTNPAVQQTTSTTAAVVSAAAVTHSVVNKAKIATATQQPVIARPVPQASGANFVVQVASFKARSDAEHMKGLLILKGFEVTVAAVSTPAQGTWYRVVIGPYPNRTLAQKAQVILAKTERLNGMVRAANG